MAKYRSKPTEIEATQWFKDGDHPAVSLAKSLGHPGVNDKWMVRTTGGGAAEVMPGDWIIVDAEPDTFYPCNPAVFARKYELAE